MSKLTNPEAFDLEAAAILAAGYKQFPGEFGWAYDSDDEGYPTDTGKSREKIQFETIRWLVDHDYLYGGGVYGGSWQGLKLTERALHALNSVPDAIDGKEPLGKRLVTAVATGSVDTIKQLISLVIQEALS